MIKATISQLKNSLSAYLDQVRAGESVLILDRKRPIARIERVAAADSSADRLGRLERAGLVRRAPGAQAGSPMPEPPVPARSVLDALLDERRESR